MPFKSETSLTLLKRERERERDVFVGSLCWPLTSGGFCFNFVCTSKGYVERETSLTLLKRERERKMFLWARYAGLSKVVVFAAILCAPVRGM